jgi:hypothetical protein
MTATKLLALSCAIVAVLAVVFFNYAIGSHGCDYTRTHVRNGVVYVWARDCVPEVVMCDDVERPGCLEAAGIKVFEGGKDLERIR